MDTKRLIEWVNAACNEARDQANAGDMAKANMLARTPALRDYFNNVTMLHTMEADQFIQYYPDKARELNALFEAYEAHAAQQATITQQADRLGVLEASLAQLETRLAKFLETTEQDASTDEDDAEPEAEAEQPKRRRTKKVDQEPEDQPDPVDTTAEGDTDTEEDD